VKIAPGINRVGDRSIVNSYLLEEAGQVTIIDAGVPGSYGNIPGELALSDHGSWGFDPCRST